MVFHEGDASDFFFVVLTGRIKVYKHGPDGHDIILEMFGPGGPLGAVATFESRPYPASASPWSHRAACSSRVRRFSSCSSGTRRWCAACSAVSSLRLVQLTTRLAELTGGRIEARFARLF
jgi:CRP/FNR family transcriptional regulator